MRIWLCALALALSRSTLMAQPPGVLWSNPASQQEDEVFWADRSGVTPIPWPNGADALFPKEAGTAKAQFTSSRLIPKEADLFYPYRTIGKLFISQTGTQEDGHCTAAVIKPRILLTAGHCVHSGKGGDSGFFRSFRFVPAFRDGQEPYGSWFASNVVVTSTWYSGNGNVPNAADYAVIVLRDDVINGTPTRIGDFVGWLGYTLKKLNPNHVTILGYPQGFDGAQRVHQVTAQSFKSFANNNVQYGDDMTEGSSGGPWIQNFGEKSIGQGAGTNPTPNTIVGVTSAGPKDNTAPKYGLSSVLDERLTGLLNTACALAPGNC